MVEMNAYIDGFNLYYGIKKWPAYKWLNIAAMLDSLFPNDRISLIRYFSANVKGEDGPRHAPAAERLPSRTWHSSSTS